ncbi:thiopeptide-type bacteriocin biosynthesis protein [Tenacibaculum sp.]|uniref:thiopeptide-type bacteriocin biosynthesis protein n=1 Tax=Tenacibaculum sp. TaxID=1906242 RepID=UPI003AA85C7A
MNNKIIQRTFIIGDKWLYYKISCGALTADTFLLEVIKPLTQQMLEENIISKWFFIRYSNPETHLRIRFYINDVSKLSKIILRVKKYTQPYVTSKQIWNIQIDTYQRELERYGTNSIEISESFFHNDSEQIISIIESYRNENDRFLAVFKRVETIIKLFNLDNQIQLSLIENMQKKFKEEFNTDKNMRKELSNKYRKIERLLFENHSLEKDIISQYFINEILELKKKNTLLIPIESLLASFIHMTINRGFSSKQRQYEMMIYDFLHRKNKSIFARYGKL